MKPYHLPHLTALLLLAGLASSGILQAGTFILTRLNNTGPGSRPVISMQGNTASGNQTVESSVSGTITRVAPLPTVTPKLRINGRADHPVISVFHSSYVCA